MPSGSVICWIVTVGIMNEITIALIEVSKEEGDNRSKFLIHSWPKVPVFIEHFAVGKAQSAITVADMYRPNEELGCQEVFQY